MSSGPNNSRARGKVHLFAVVRYDPQFTPPEAAFTVKEVLPTLAEAKAEGDRLSKVARGGASYFCQTTRFYPKGRGVRTNAARASGLRVVGLKRSRG